MAEDPSLENDLVSVFAEVSDPRVDRGKLHKLEDILTIAVCATICGADSFVEMALFGKSKEEWFASFLELPNRIPSHDTFRAVFMALDPESFLEAFMRWTEGIREKVAGEVVALDGKVLRGAVDAGENPRCIVGAWASENGLALGQLKTKEKSNEITAVPELLAVLALEGCIVTLDAMGCQKSVAAKVREGGADYVLAVKGNQEKLHMQVSTYFEELTKGGTEPDLEVQGKQQRGRREVRRCWVADDLEDWLEGRQSWRDIRSVAAVELERTEGEKITVETRYFISSLGADAPRIAHAVRAHWGIENSLHWVLDVAFDEDRSRTRNGNAPENLATLRRWTLNLIRNEKSNAQASVKARRKLAGWDNAYLTKLLGQKLDA
jgi:predicted transposase YbfD/YdcC